MDFNLKIPVTVVSGAGCVKEYGEKLCDFGDKCLIVTGGKSAALSGAMEDVFYVLNKYGIKHSVFSGIEPNPHLDTCHKAGTMAREVGAKFLIGIGGGSVLDGTKAAAIYAANENMTPEEIYCAKERKKSLPLVLIGTTAGTGSEVGTVSVLTNPKTNRKKSINYPDSCPKLTFADSRYTHSMPYSLTKSTALDALSHALEGYFSPKCSDIPAMFAEKAISLIWFELKKLYKTQRLPDDDGREKLYYGSLYAGITLSYCGTAFPHPLGYVLTENYNVPHGMACAAFMQPFILRAEKYEPEKAKRVFSLIDETTESFCEVINDLTETGSIKMTDDEIKNYCSRWEENIPNNFRFSPGGFTKDEAMNLFKKQFSKDA